MTAKEKAKELVRSIYSPIDWNTAASYEKKLYVAKKCALICVDEIMMGQDAILYTPVREYWEEVKQEINKL